AAFGWRPTEDHHVRVLTEPPNAFAMCAPSFTSSIENVSRRWQPGRRVFSVGRWAHGKKSRGYPIVKAPYASSQAAAMRGLLPFVEWRVEPRYAPRTDNADLHLLRR